MSWLSVKGGYLLQCDRCGYTRGSLYQSDDVKHGRGRTPFREKRKPVSWQDWSTDNLEAHLCPECVRRGG